MTHNLEYYQLEAALTLRTPQNYPLTINTFTLSLGKQDNQIIECRLIFPVTFEQYQYILQEAIFNLKLNLISPLAYGEFIADIEIKIEVILQPNLLSELLENSTNAEKAANYLLTLDKYSNNIPSSITLSNISISRTDKEDNPQQIHPLLNTESWLCLSVKQQQESGEIGYRTFWSYVSPETLSQSATSGEEITQQIINLFQDFTKAKLSTNTEKATTEIIEGINNFFTDLAELDFDKIIQKIEEENQLIPTENSIFEEIINFFQEEEWNFIQIKNEPVLQMAFQGENGTWTCYARIRVEQKQFIFYSICPVNAPENKRNPLSEFLTRANYDIIIGNFELDFNDGEIRYKTSIDVENDRLSFTLIKNLVYANVMMMDKYLSGIMSLIYSNISPEEAILQVEK